MSRRIARLMMLLIAYDLHPAPGRDYSIIENAIRSYGIWAHLEGSVWIVDTTQGPKAVTEQLMNLGHPQDSFFVVRLQQNWWSTGLTQNIIDWIKDPTRRW